jgi:hypothetical protein
MSAEIGCDPDDETTHILGSIPAHMITRRTQFKEEVVNEII